MGTKLGTAIIGIATATWRHRSATTGISPGPRRCHDGGCSVGGGDVSVHRYLGSIRRWDSDAQSMRAALLAVHPLDAPGSRRRDGPRRRARYKTGTGALRHVRVG